MNLSKIIMSPIFENAGVSISDSRSSDIVVHDSSFFNDILLRGSLGLGDSYMEGKWDCDNIDEVISKILKSGIYQQITHIYDASRSIKDIFQNLQDRKGARKVIEEHYDLPVEIYAAFLDPYFQYTCAFFDGTDKLNEAQIKKMDLICKKLDLKEGQRVLDIGGGWGGLARFMIEKYGVKPTVITLSKEQASHIRNTQGKNVEVWECDYRDIPKKLKELFDAVSTVGMLEHIGLKNYPEYMKIVSKSLKNEGRFLLHTIYTPYHKPESNSWSDKHIFPNGEIAPKEDITKTAQMHFKQMRPFFQELTPHYPPTLIAWNQNLTESISKGDIEMPEKEQRKWHYYFMSYAGAFRANHAKVGQFLYEK